MKQVYNGQLSLRCSALRSRHRLHPRHPTGPAPLPWTVFRLSRSIFVFASHQDLKPQTSLTPEAAEAAS
jgi:hypothetical protein